MQNLFAGFFISLLIHLGLVLSVSNIFNIDLLDFQADYSPPIPAYLVFEEPELISKKKYESIIIKNVISDPRPKINIEEIILKADKEILILESKASQPKKVKKKELHLNDKNTVLFFSSIIEEQIKAVWKKPIASDDLSVEIFLSMVPTGEILGVEVTRSSGSEAFDRSALIAVAKVEKFENLSMPAKLFDDNFRNFTLVFKPQ